MFDTISCSSCQRKLRLPEAQRGKAVQCPACGARFLTPAPPAEEEDLPLLTLVQAPESVPAEEIPRRPERPAEHIPTILPYEEDEEPPAGRRWSEPDRPLPSLRKRSNRTVWVLVSVTLAVASVGIMVVWQPGEERAPKQVPFKEDEEDPEDFAESVRDDVKLGDIELSQEVQAFFQALHTALQDQDLDEGMACFDFQRMSEELKDGQDVPPIFGRRKRELLRILRSGMPTALAKDDPVTQWTTFKVRHIKTLRNGEVAVIVRHQLPEGGSLKMRWWLIRGGGTWRIFDMEDLNLGMRTSVRLTALAELDQNDPAQTILAVSSLSEALVLLRKADVDGAEKKLQQARGVQLSPKLEALRHLADGIIHLKREEFEEALEALDKVKKCNPDIPLADALRGKTLNKLRKWAEAFEYLEAYRHLLGDEADVCRELGLSLRGLYRLEEAADFYRKALDRNPKDAEAFLGLLLSLNGEDPAADVAARFAKLENARTNFALCAEECRKHFKFNLVEQLARAMRKIDPRHVPVEHYLSLVRAQAGQATLATAHHRAALAGQKDPKQRAEYTRLFLETMVQGGKATEAYEATPDRRTAFRILAGQLKWRYPRGPMKQLLAAHAQKDAGDPLLLLYQGEEYVRDQQHKRGDEAFTAAVRKRPDPQTLVPFRYYRVLARHHLGRGLSAYADIGPRDETFRQLAWLFLGRKDFKELQALLDLRARDDPTGKDLLEHRIRLNVRQKQFAAGIALFRGAIGKRPPGEVESLASVLLSEMALAGKSLEGYRAVPDRRQAFRELMDSSTHDGTSRKDRPRLLAVHRTRHAGDPWLLYWTGILHAEDLAWTRAAAAFAPLWKTAVGDLRRRLPWPYAQAMYKTGRVLEAYRESGENADVYTQLVQLLCADRKGAELEKLIAVHRPNARDDSLLLLHAARAKVFLKQPAEAAVLFQRAYKKQLYGYQRRSYATTFLRDMEAIGKGLDAYRAVPDKSLAFQTLAGDLVMKKNARELEMLLAEHPATGADGPLHSFYQGELYLLRGDLVRAEANFRAALKRVTPRYRWTFRYGLFRASIKAGKVAATYEEFGRDATTFEALASRCMFAKDGRQLEELIAAHRKAHPEDSNLPAHDLDLKWLSKDYEGALKLLAKDPGSIFAQRYSWKANDYRMRCLVRLKRAKEALLEAERQRKTGGYSLLRVLAQAAQGDVEQTIAVMGALSPQSYFVRACYDDEDLGPLLKSAPFAAFRAKFPAPKKTQPFP